MKNIPSTKIEISYNKIERMKELDELARILFPSNRDHQRIFLTIFIELKYARDQFLPSLTPLCNQYDISPRMLETVRSKMRRMGIIDHVCRFNKKTGYREGWKFSHRFNFVLLQLNENIDMLRKRKDTIQERKDRDLFKYL